VATVVSFILWIELFAPFDMTTSDVLSG